MSSNEFDNFVEFKKKYKELIRLVHKNSGEDKLNIFIENVSDEDLQLLINNFCRSIENDKKSRKLFLNRNERLFSETSNIKIIPSFNLKKCLLNSENSSYIWECIQLLYAIYRTGDESKKELVTKVVEKIEQFNLSNNKVSNGKGTNVDNMIMDIADTLRNNLVMESKSNSKVNPIENMIKTSQMISQKYGNQLRQGNISMNDMFNSLGKMMEKIDEKTSNDEELQNIDVSDMPKPDELMKDLGLGNIGGEGMGNPMDMLSSLMGGNKDKKSKSKKLTSEQIKEMEEFYKNMDTSDLKASSLENGSNIEIIDETNIEQDPKMPDVGDLLNDLGGSDGGMPNVGDLLNGLGGSDGGMPNINEMLNSLNGDVKEGENLDDKLNKINESLISQLPKDKQQDIKMMTENMAKIMKTVSKN